MRRTARTAADGVGAREWLEIVAGDERGCADGCGRQMGAEKRGRLSRWCADGCGRQMGAENCVDGCGWRGCNGGEEAAGDERPWLRGRLRTRVRRTARTAADGVQGGGWKWVGRRSRW